MENFIFSLNATVPIFLVMVLGWFLMQIKFFNKEFVDVADKYVFKVALPVLLFKDIATADIRSDFDLKFVLFCMFVTIISFLIIWLLSYIFIKEKASVGAFVQASARGSSAVLGIAFINNIYGDSGMAPLMIVSAVPFYNILSVVVLTFCADLGKDKTINTDDKYNFSGKAGKENSVKGSSVKIHNSGKGMSNIKKACINVAKNPIILGILAGLLVSLPGIKIPEIPMKAVTNVAQTATPVALLVVGASFEGAKAIKKIKLTVIATFIKLIALPLIFIPVAILFGFTGSELMAILIMLGAPTTVACYVMAKNMGNDEVLTSSVVVLATLLSSVTLTAWIYILKVLGFI